MDSPPIELFIVDVDGTLLTPDKELTDRARRAVSSLRDAGVNLALTSGRPPRGLRMLIAPLAIETPLAAFNGGMFVAPDLTILEQQILEEDAARRGADLLERNELDVWVYSGADWYIRDRGAPHVEREQNTVQFAPTVIGDLTAVLDSAVKIVGVSDDHDLVARCEREAKALGPGIYAARSQPYYLDLTHPEANKGHVLEYLSQTLSIEPARIATIGDMPNDVAMFRESGLSIAMGHASREVRQRADHVTGSNTEEGFARAVEDVILARASG